MLLLAASAHIACTPSLQARSNAVPTVACVRMCVHACVRACACVSAATGMGMSDCSDVLMPSPTTTARRAHTRSANKRQPENHDNTARTTCSSRESIRPVMHARSLEPELAPLARAPPPPASPPSVSYPWLPVRAFPSLAAASSAFAAANPGRRAISAGPPLSSLVTNKRHRLATFAFTCASSSALAPPALLPVICRAIHWWWYEIARAPPAAVVDVDLAQLHFPSRTKV
jgi:hypothetical protein